MDESETQQNDNNQQTTVGIDGVESTQGIVGEDAVKQQTNSRVVGKPFVKGDPRINRKGAPKKVTIWDYLEEGEDEIKIRAFINDPTKIKEVAEYILGKPKQPLVGGDEGDNPIEFKWQEQSKSNTHQDDGRKNSTTP